MDINEALTKSIRSVAKNFTKEKRTVSRTQKIRPDRYWRTYRNVAPDPSIKDSAYEVMEEAYLSASENGAVPANVRQIMYALRPLIQKKTPKRWKNDEYLIQLVNDYIKEYPYETDDWNVVYDARGHLVEPHSRVKIPLGTLEVRSYMAEWTDENYVPEPEISLPHAIDTRGPYNRYEFAFFCEKEGFDELWKKFHLADKWDIGIMSTKGMSTTAARELVERLSMEGVTILVLHDFDKSGLGIFYTLAHDTERYEYTLPPNVIDLGFRFEDIKDIPRETVYYNVKKDPRIKLREYGATEEECNILIQSGSSDRGWVGQRVELNAMLPPSKLVQWLEAKFKKIGVKKVVPKKEILEKAHKRAHQIAYLENALEEAAERYKEDELDKDLKIPKNLKATVKKKLKDSHRSWDNVLYEIAEEKLEEDELSMDKENGGGKT